MTAVAIVSLYFLALTAFLGLDLVSKVPARFYAVGLAVLGTATAVIALAGLRPAGAANVMGLRAAALVLGAFAAGAGLGALVRLVGPLARKRPSP
ncbi:MAG TPA: hypothetical protein VGF45_12060 [Polyangia bacterium]